MNLAGLPVPPAAWGWAGRRIIVLIRFSFVTVHKQIWYIHSRLSFVAIGKRKQSHETRGLIACSEYVEHFYEGILRRLVIGGISHDQDARMKHLPNSSDLSVGRRPEFKSDEFGKSFIMVRD